MSNQHNAVRKKSSSIQNWAAGLTLPFLLAGTMGAAVPSFAANDAEPPAEKHEVKNPRIAAIQTEHVKLDNGLQALLIHDPNANESAAAMVMGIGGIYEDRPGAMHFYEHMKHTGKYAEFVQANGGGRNAYTAEDHVNYGFTIATYALPEQLSRFSRFFKNPSYDPVHTEKEVEAVDHEFQNSYMNDGNRLNALGKRFSEPGHPYNNFVIGNIDTLKGVTVDELKAIDSAMVSADNLHLALLSDMPLAEQKKLVVEHFSGIPKFEVKQREISKDFRKPLNGEYRFLQVQPVKDTHALMLEFPTTSMQENQDNKPHDILESIISYPGEGSLASYLKKEGLALGVDAGAESVHKNVNSFS
ncbi:MAG TPA: insulinase family protein, partial [Micavibrio sp.]